MKLLIVEDYMLVAMALKLLVIELGHTVVGVASTPSKAIRIAEEMRPDLALVDIRLEHNTNGVDAANEIYEQFGIRSIYVTAYRRDAIPIRASLGCLLKPYSQNDIRLSLNAMECVLNGEPLPAKIPEALELYPDNFPPLKRATS
jgi:DNA-binding NarL/FixJ family response regulator